MADQLYNTEAWKRLRRAKLARDPLCEYCPPGRLTTATQVDHKQAIRNGGDPWAWDNLASCCQSCHSSKTGADKRGARWVRKGCDERGRPLDGSHWWRAKP
ncbi:MAG TPA: HNH endonuclease signature motif containing protein [Syntrophobacter fumaroxidans]|nr:HNH endonuclease signature motif containing protein [Syntrophobacter fumaroxidans]